MEEPRDFYIEIIGNKVYTSFKNLGIIDNRIMSLSSFLSCLQGINNSLKTPILLKDTILYSIQEDKESFITFHPTSRSDIKYREDKNISLFKDVCFPSVILKNVFHKTSLVNSYIYALKDVEFACDIDMSTRLYRMIYPNTWDDGRICWGDKRIERETYNLSFDMYKISPFNSDLFNGAGGNNKIQLINNKLPQIHNGNDYFNYMSKAEEYPEELYISTNFTLGDIL